MISLHAFENILLISPILFLYTKASERHQFLESTIGPNHLEIDAMNTIWNLVLVSTCLVLLSVPIQIVLFFAYTYYGHPWRRILAGDQNADNDKANNVQNADNYVLTEVIVDSSLKIRKRKDSQSSKLGHDIKEEGKEGSQEYCDAKMNDETGQNILPSTKNDPSTEMSSLDEAYALLQNTLKELNAMKK